MKDPGPTNPDGARRKAERDILVFTCTAHAFTHIYMVVHTVILEPMRLDLGLSLADLTGYLAIGATFFGLGAVPAGWLSDHLGQKPLLVAFFFLTSLGGAAVGLARGPAQLTAGMVCMGLGASIFHPVGNSIIARGVQSPGRAMGTNGLWGSLGVAIGPVLASLVAVKAGWRWVYLGLLPPMFLAGLLLARTPLRLPARPPPAPRGNSRKIPAVLLLLFLAMAVGGLYFWIVKTMLPEHLRIQTRQTAVADALGALPPLLQAGVLTAIIYAIGGLGQYAVGRLIRPGREFKLYVAIFTIEAPLIYAVGLASGAPLVLTACVMSVFLFSPQPVENALLARVSPERWKGLVYGLKFVLTFGLGGAGTYLSGWVAGGYGTGAVFSVAACVCLGAVGVSLATLIASRRKLN